MKMFGKFILGFFAVCFAAALFDDDDEYEYNNSSSNSYDFDEMEREQERLYEDHKRTNDERHARLDEELFYRDY